jgi:hypothetical protein
MEDAAGAVQVQQAGAAQTAQQLTPDNYVFRECEYFRRINGCYA